MEIKEFIANFADQFEETETSLFTAETKFKEEDEWSSLIGLSLLNMIEKTYGIKLTFDELKKAITIQNLFDIVEKKQNNG